APGLITPAAAAAISRTSATTTPNNLTASELRTKRDGATAAAAVAAGNFGGETVTVTSVGRPRRRLRHPVAGVSISTSWPASCRSARPQQLLGRTPRHLAIQSSKAAKFAAV